MLWRGLFREIDEGGKVVGGTRVHRLTEVTVGVWSRDYRDPGRIGAIMVSLVPAWQAECDARRQSMALGLGRIMPTTC